MSYYLISDDELNIIDNASCCMEVLREGRRDPDGYTLTMNNDGSYTRHYFSDEMLSEDEVLIHFYGCETTEKAFVLKRLPDDKISMLK